MTTWWNGLNLTQQIFALFALPATVILAIQTILLLLGLGSHHDGGLDPNGAHEANVHDGGTDMNAGAHDGGAINGHPDDDHILPAHQDAAADYDPGLRLFTVRGLIAFFAVGGWVGIALVDLQVGTALASLLALLAGLLALFLVAWLLRLLLGLQSSGNLDIRNAVGLTGIVYLHIPGNLQGSGKVTLILQGRSIEIDALTDLPDGIATGRQIKVISLRGDLLLVRPLRE